LAAATRQDTLISIDAPGLIAGASDSDSETLTAGLIANASHGTATVNADGSWSYMPNSSYHGTDSFRFAVSDSASSATATVYLMGNDAPYLVDGESLNPIS